MTWHDIGRLFQKENQGYLLPSEGRIWFTLLQKESQGYLLPSSEGRIWFALLQRYQD